jgi:hypothetical protein
MGEVSCGKQNTKIFDKFLVWAVPFFAALQHFTHRNIAVY